MIDPHSAIKASEPELAKSPALLREKFREFVDGSFYSSLIKSMRKATPTSKLIHGGRAEEVFQSQLDQTLVNEIVNASAGKLSDALFEQFMRIHAKDPQTGAPSHETTTDRAARSHPVGLNRIV